MSFFSENFRRICPRPPGYNRTANLKCIQYSLITHINDTDNFSRPSKRGGLHQSVMSGSYWPSTQRRKWQFTKESLAMERQKLWLMECQLFPQGLNIVMDSKQNGTSRMTTKNIPITQKDLHYDRDYNLRIYCYFLIMKLGRRLNIRQCALATAHVYLSRFLLRVSVREINLYLLVTTCVYLACKVEECPQYIRTLVSESRSLWPEVVPPDPTKVTEFEFYLIEELQSYLVIYHPYSTMEQIVNVLKGEPFHLQLSAEDQQNCWSLINDSYINDAHLTYPPHIIAVACLFVTISMRAGAAKKAMQNSSTNIQGMSEVDAETALKHQEIFNRFLAESQVDLEEVTDTIQELISLYDHWDKYHEPWIKFLLHTLYLRSPASSARSS